MVRGISLPSLSGCNVVKALGAIVREVHSFLVCVPNEHQKSYDMCSSAPCGQNHIISGTSGDRLSGSYVQ